MEGDLLMKNYKEIKHLAEEAKKIATEAREKMKILCPALVQKAIHS